MEKCKAHTELELGGATVFKNARCGKNNHRTVPFLPWHGHSPKPVFQKWAEERKMQKGWGSHHVRILEQGREEREQAKFSFPSLFPRESLACFTITRGVGKCLSFLFTNKVSVLSPQEYCQLLPFSLGSESSVCRKFICF